MGEPLTQGRSNLQDQRNVSLILGLLAGCLVYVGACHLSLPVPCYLPEVGEWSLSPPPGLIAMRYYGLLLYGMGGFLVGWVVGRLPGVALCFETRRWARGLAGSAVAGVAGGLLYSLVVELSSWAGR